MTLTDLKAMKCKTCGEPLDLSKAQCGVIKCAVCDSCFTLPKTDASQKVLDYLFQAEGDLDTGKFEDAHVKYSKAAELDKTEPEAYWGMALAEFKIQYLKDEVNNRLQPICHEINDKDFADSPYFLKALRYATDEQRKEYERKAEEINYIKNEFYKIANSGVKYDCFICVKVTDDNNGGRTQDYKTADDIYFELKGKGYKPFFSERELVGVTGADYEARILYALKSAECMLVICFDEAYLRTKWVKNEYSRFLKLVNDEEKESDSIALVFGDRPVEKLPGKKGKIQGIALNSLTAMERIVSFVDAHTPEARKRREEAQRKREEDAKRKAQEDEVLRQRFAEQEERAREQAELLRQQEERARQQEELIRQLQEQMQSQAQAQPSVGLSDAELFERFERARQEKERKERERQEAERKAREELERIAREKKAAEERARQEKEREAREAAERERIERDRKAAEERIRQEKARREREIQEAYNSRNFDISFDVLKKYKGSSSEVFIPYGVKIIKESAFRDYNKIKIITIPDSVTDIEQSAFARCKGLTSIAIPNSVKSIGDEAFASCIGLTSLTIPSSVTSIAGNAFYGCSGLESITVDIDNPNYKSENNCILTKDGKTLISGCKKSIIPDGVTSIAEYAFGACSELASIAIPNSVTSIGKGAFQHCEKLIRTNIPNGVTSISESVFYECSNLANINIPDGVTDIGETAFCECSKLTNLTIPKSVTSINEDAFAYCADLTSIKVDADNPNYKSVNNCILTKDGKTLILGCKTSVIPDGVTSIGNGAFFGNGGLTSIIIPDSVTSIGNRAFFGCDGLTSITIPNSVTSIGEEVFFCCEKLESINYDGKKKQWEDIPKGNFWDSYTRDYTVYFSRGLTRKMNKIKK